MPVSTSADGSIPHVHADAVCHLRLVRKVAGKLKLCVEVQSTDDLAEPPSKRLKPAASFGEGAQPGASLKKIPSKKRPPKKGVSKKGGMGAKKYLNTKVLTEVMTAIRNSVKSTNPMYLKWFQVIQFLPADCQAHW